MKAQPLLSIAVLGSLLAVSVFGAEATASATPKERSSILGVDLKAIQAAVPAFEKHGMKIDGYRVIVIEEKEALIVLFDDPERSPGQMPQDGNDHPIERPHQPMRRVKGPIRFAGEKRYDRMLLTP